MHKLEIITDFKQLQKRIDTLQTMLPDLEVITRSSFYVILGCYLPSELSQPDKVWLQKMLDERVILRYRCKAREDR